MEDRFRFRAFCKDTKEMFDVYDFTDEFVHEEVEDGFEVHFRIDCILEQCTGLKDNTGKLIYEGDILKNLHNGRYIVEWRVNGFWYVRICRQMRA